MVRLYKNHNKNMVYVLVIVVINVYNSVEHMYISMGQPDGT